MKDSFVKLVRAFVKRYIKLLRTCCYFANILNNFPVMCVKLLQKNIYRHKKKLIITEYNY